MSRGVRLSSAGPATRPSLHVTPDARSGPARTCVGCREVGSRSALLRVVVRHDGDSEDTLGLALDLGRCMPGRGAWLHPDPLCLELALRRGAFPRALRLAGPLDGATLRRELAAAGGQLHSTGSMPGAARPSEVDMGSGLEADGYPMSTQP